METKRSEFVSIENIVFIIVNFIILWLFRLLTIILKFLITLRTENNNGHPGLSYMGGAPEHLVLPDST